MENTFKKIKKIEQWLIDNSSNQDIDLLTRMQVKLAGYKAYLCGVLGELDIELSMAKKRRKIEEGRIWAQERENGSTPSASETVAKRMTSTIEAEEILVDGNLNRIKRHIDGITGILDSTRQRVAYLRDESNKSR